MVQGACKIMTALLLINAATGCATNRANTLLLMTGVGIAAASLAYSLSPPDERPEMHALYGGAMGAVASGVAGLFIFDEQKRSAEFQRQALVMKKELDSFKEYDGSSHGPELMYETKATIGKSMPAEYERLLKPGKWSVFKLNQWVTQGEGTLIHQDRMVKLIPPQLNPHEMEDPE